MGLGAILSAEAVPLGYKGSYFSQCPRFYTIVTCNVRLERLYCSLELLFRGQQGVVLASKGARAQSFSFAQNFIFAYAHRLG